MLQPLAAKIDLLYQTRFEEAQRDYGKVTNGTMVSRMYLEINRFSGVGAVDNSSSGLGDDVPQKRAD